MWMIRVTCFCVSVGLASTTLFAQDTQALHPGIRLRVTAPAQSSKSIVGTLSAFDPSILMIQTSREQIAVRRDAIQNVEISECRSWKKRGALIGAGLGMAGAIVLAVTDKQEPFLFSDKPWLTRSQIFLGGTILFAPIGAGRGALVSPGERWMPAPTLPPATADSR